MRGGWPCRGVSARERDTASASCSSLSRASGICLAARAEVDVMAWKKALEQGALIPSEEGRYRIPEPLWITGDQVSASLFWLDENATSCP